MKNSRSLLAGYFLAGVILIITAVLSLLAPADLYRLSNSSVNNLNDEWRTVSGDESGKNINLPVNENVKINGVLSIERQLPKDFHSSQHILFRSSLQEIRVFVDNEEIYNLKFENNSVFNLPALSLWNIIEIPEESEGKDITVSVKSNFARFSGVVNPVIYGSKGDLNLYIIKNYFPTFIISIFILLFGMFLCLSPIFIKSGQKSTLLFLGLFTSAVSIWFISESRMLQFFTGNPIILGGLAYLALPVSMAPLSGFIREIVSVKFKKIFSIFTVSFLLEFISIIILQFSGIMPFYNSLLITHILVAFFLVTTISIITYEIVKNKNINAKNIFYASVFLIVFGIAEMVSFYISRSTLVGKYFLAGVIFFIVFQSAVFLRQIQVQNLKSIETDMLRELAYKDYMTGGGNRLAFEIDLEEIFSDSSRLQNTGLIYFDVDGLKKINDELGHVKGDEAIIFAYNTIDEIFAKNGRCYRIGGDEFAAIVTFEEDGIEKKIKNLINEFEINLQGKNEEFDISPVISVGGVQYDPKLDRDAKSIMARADKAMYLNKIRNKIKINYENEKTKIIE